MKLKALALIMAAACWPGLSLAQNISAPAGFIPVQGICFGAVGVAATCVDSSNPLPVTSGASSSSSAALTSIVSTATESSHVLKSSAGNLYGVYATVGATAGYLLVFDATSAPADGAVTPKQCIVAPANATTGITFGSGPAAAYATGIVAVFSSTGCFTKTASATAFFNGRVQ